MDSDGSPQHIQPVEFHLPGGCIALNTRKDV